MNYVNPEYDYGYGSGYGDYGSSYGDYGSTYGDSMGSAFAILGVGLIVFYLLILAYAVLGYVFQSLALYRIAKNRNLRYPGLAWVPVANTWLIGSIVDYHSSINSGIDRKWRKALLAIGIIFSASLFLFYMFYFVLGFSMVFGNMSAAGLIIPLILILLVVSLSSVANSICTMICFYKIYEDIVPLKAVKYLLLTILVPLGGPICLFIASKSMIGVPIYQPAYYPPQDPNTTV